MTTFETIIKHETEYGKNNFIEVARKVAKGDDGSHEFISVVRGYVDNTGSRRYKTQLTFPGQEDLIAFVRNALEKV